MFSPSFFEAAEKIGLVQDNLIHFKCRHHESE